MMEPVIPTAGSMPTPGKIRVLIVDDSALIRSILQEIINSFPDLTVVGAASDPLQAREMIKALNPDVLTLDVEMPKMDGLTFLEKLMRLRPMPVLMISSLTEKGSEVALRALELGAVDFITKPKLGVAEGIQAYAEDIANRIRVAARARIKYAGPTSVRTAPLAHTIRFATTEKLLIVGASTGGTEAIKELLLPLPADAPAVLITQHMPETFTKSFAARLDGLCRMTVLESRGNERVLPGHVYIAPGHSHLLLERSGAHYMTCLSQAAPVNHHRPSVDVLFHSAARHAGRNAIGVILTGMGRDGAQGMAEMQRAGAWTIAQNEATCVVYGMPRAAVEAGGVNEVLPLADIASRILQRFSEHH